MRALAERPDQGVCLGTAEEPDLGPDVVAALKAAAAARVAAAAEWSVRERLPRLEAPASRAPVRDVGGW